MMPRTRIPALKGQPEGLKAFFERIYRPERLSCRETITRYRSEILRLCKFIGKDDPRADEITQEHVRKFSESRAVYSGAILLAILRHANPERFHPAVAKDPFALDDEGTVRHFYLQTYERMRLGCASDSCRKQYQANIRKLSNFLGHPACLADLNEETLTGLMQSIVKRGRSPATANKVRSQLVALWNYAAKKGCLREFPALNRLREYTRVPTAWNREQLQRLFAALEIQKGYIGQVPARLWWLALHSLLWDTGARIGVTLRIEWEHVDLEAATLLLVAEHQKDAADQVFRLHPDTINLLKLIQQPERQLVFPWSLDYGTLWNRYKAILKGAGLPHGRRDKFHRMRRSTASWFEAAGGNATELLGHSMRSITMKYLDPVIVQRQHASDVLFRPVVAEVKGGAA